MTIIKFTPGYVEQWFDSKTKELQSQNFVADTDVTYYDENYISVTDPKLIKGLYHPFDMKQPEDK